MRVFCFLFLVLISKAFANDTDYLKEFKICDASTKDSFSHCFNKPQTAKQSFILQHSKSSESQAEYTMVLFHGLSDSPYYVKDMAYIFAQNKINVIAPVLSGHATNMQDLANTPYQKWQEDAKNAIDLARSMGKKILVGGFSNGTLIALDSYLKNQDIHGLFLVGPMLHPALKLSATCWTSVQNFLDNGEGINYGQHTRYSKIPSASVCQLVNFHKEIENNLKSSKINIPVFVFASKDDAYADSLESIYWFQENSKKPELNSYFLIGKNINREWAKEIPNLRLEKHYKEFNHAALTLANKGLGGDNEVNQYYRELHKEVELWLNKSGLITK